MKDDLPTGEHDEAKQAIKCGDCGGTDFTPYNPKTGLMTCADCGQFKQTNASLATAPVVGRQRAEAIVGTLFDDTAACAETLKEAVIDRFASATFNPAPVVTAMLEWL